MSNANNLKSPAIEADGGAGDFALPSIIRDAMEKSETSSTAATDKTFLKSASKALRNKKSNSENLGSTKVVNLLRKALNHFHAAEYREALEFCLRATELHTESAMGHHIMALALEKLGETHKALLMYERTLELDPTQFDVYLNLGSTAMALEMKDAAEKFIRLYIDLKPDLPHGYNDLGTLLSDQNRFDDAIEIVRFALNLMPEVPMLWNTMGTIAYENQQKDEAITFYNEALRLDPNFHRARYNLGNLYFNYGDVEKALDSFEAFIEVSLPNHADTMEAKYARSQALLSLGRIEEGWREYQVRNKPLFRASTLFATEAPFWNGEDLEGKTIMVIGEQGVGDEILFANPIRDLIARVGTTGNVLISVTPRLVRLFERAYPECKVGSPSFTKHNGKLVHFDQWVDDLGKLDYISPMGDLNVFLRPTPESYHTSTPIIAPDPEDILDWKTRLAEISDGPFVGICWRSGMLTSGRQKLFASLDIWGPLLKRDDITLINLQYGDVDSEIAEIEARFGKKVHQMEGLDIRDDLDSNAALCGALDLVVSAATAASAIAAGVGTETWILLPDRSWVLLGEEEYPWYPKTRAFKPDSLGKWETAIAKVNSALDGFVERTRD